CSGICRRIHRRCSGFFAGFAGMVGNRCSNCRGQFGDDPDDLMAGCVAGAMDYDEYIRLIEKMGFINITLHKEKEIFLPDEVLSPFLSPDEVIAFRSSGTGIFSITISGEKPAKGCVCCGT
ncbi:MAG: hypothetical protein R6W71_00745, partial [Bacteroidales bacterium]